MSNLIPGTYKAQPDSVQFGIVEKSGNEYVRLGFVISFEDGSSESISADLFFTVEKNTARSIESLRYCGWTGTDLATLDMGVDGMGSAVVDLVLDSESYTDPETNVTTDRLRVKWINRPGGVPVAKPMSGAQRAQFAARLKGALMVDARANGTKPAAAAAPARSTNARPAARTAPAPSPANGGAPQWDGTGPDPSASDDIPFLPTARVRRASARCSRSARDGNGSLRAYPHCVESRARAIPNDQEAPMTPDQIAEDARTLLAEIDTDIPDVTKLAVVRRCEAILVERLAGSIAAKRAELAAIESALAGRVTSQPEPTPHTSTARSKVLAALEQAEVIDLSDLEAKARAATSCGCCARNEPCAETAHGMRCCICCMGTGREPGNVTLDGDTVLALVAVARAAKASLSGEPGSSVRDKALDAALAALDANGGES